MTPGCPTCHGVFDTGHARKTDATDAHAIAAGALRTPHLRVLAFDEELLALRLLVDRRDELSALRVQTVNRLHRLLTELSPGGAEKDLTATNAKRLLATVRPRSVVGTTIRRMAVAACEGLRRYSPSANIKLHDVAQRLVGATAPEGQETAWFIRFLDSLASPDAHAE